MINITLYVKVESEAENAGGADSNDRNNTMIENYFLNVHKFIARFYDMDKKVFEMMYIICQKLIAHIKNTTLVLK